MDAGESGDIVLTVCDAADLFDGGRCAPRHAPAGLPRTWDDIGAAMGEPGVVRLLRMVQYQPDASRVVIRIRAGAERPSLVEQSPDDLFAQLRTWYECKQALNTAEIRMCRRLGSRALLLALGGLAVAMTASWLIASESILGPPLLPRRLMSEAIVIAGWVIMWRPFEMLLFDPVRPAHENRLVTRLLAMRWSVEPWSVAQTRGSRSAVG